MRTSAIIPFLMTLTSPVASRIAAPIEENQRKLVPSADLGYRLVGNDLKCGEDGRMFKSTATKNVEECQQRCYNMESCNFFTFWESNNMCIGCTLENDSYLEQHTGFDAYELTTIKTPEDFGYELWNGVAGINKKCPYKHEDRITKHDKTTKEECYEFCKEDPVCGWFSWGEPEAVEKEQGNCMLCKEDDDLDYHEKFNFWTVLRDLEPDDSSSPTPSPTPAPTLSPAMKPICPGEQKAVKSVGVTEFDQSPFSIVSYDTTSVTVTITQTATGPDSTIDYMYWRYKPSIFEDKCYEDTFVQGGDTDEFTVYCNPMTNFALVQVFFADDIKKGVLSEGDNAVVSRCCHSDLPEGIPVVSSTFEISCVQLC